MFRAYEPDQDKLVAVKLFRLDVAPDRTHRLVAAIEQLIAADLTHPAIAAPLATGISGVHAYLAQDFVAADSLDIVIREHGAAPPHEAVRIATQLAGALDFAAVVTVFHGALHPRDVLVSSDDTRVTGLGIAQAVEGIGIPTPLRRPYAAPERSEGGAWDRRADVFSLAALTYELLLARRVSAYGQDAADTLTDLPGCDMTSLRAVFARALAVAPSARFPTALAFAEALRESLVPSSVTAVAPAVAVAPLLAPAEPPAERSRPTARPSDVIEAEAEPRLPLDAVAELPLRTEELEPELVLEAGEPEPPIVSEPPFMHPAPDVPPARERTRIAAHLEEREPVTVPPVIPVMAGDRAPALSGGAYHADARRDARIWPLALTLIIGVALGFGIRELMGTAAPGVAQRAADVAAPEDARPAPAIVPPAAPPTQTATTGTDARTPVDNSAAVAAAPAPASVERPPAPLTDRAEAAVRPAPPAGTGSLLVRSAPAGAVVIVNGRSVGRTPITLRDLSRGTHTVRVARDGYVAQERRVTLSASRPAQSLTMELVRERRAASVPASAAGALGRYAAPLVVESRPAGANVFIDGKLVGQTPLMLPEVAAGAHVVRLELSGYNRWSASVRVVAGERNRVAASLEQP